MFPSSGGPNLFIVCFLIMCLNRYVKCEGTGTGRCFKQGEGASGCSKNCSPERHGISPGQHIAVGVVFVVGGAGPGADQDLEHGVESVEAEEVVDGCLGGGLGPHSDPGVLVVQQLQAPEEVVHLD